MRNLPLVSNTSNEWPTIEVTNEAIADPQWRPSPFTEFVVKIHSRCNLACDYCYVYEMADATWRLQEKSMSLATAEQFAARLGEYVRTHEEEMSRVSVILHGGEPLLAGAELIEHLVRKVRLEVPSNIEVAFRVTTNGTLLDKAMLETLRMLDIEAFVSLDGGQEDNDRHRKYVNGKGSFNSVARGIDLIRKPRYVDLFAGILCTVDVTNDPIDTYETLISFGSPMIDFLLPHGNWTEPPPHWGGDLGRTPYADWLIPIFNRWYDASSKPTSVRMFDEILAVMLGGHSRIETVGLGPFQTVAIDTGGSIDLDHQLKSNYQGAHLTGSNVKQDSFDSLALNPNVVARQRGIAGLCEECKSCPIRDVCGGGHYAHRYKKGTGYLNRSVYCADLIRLIAHMHERVLADLNSALRRESKQEDGN